MEEVCACNCAGLYVILSKLQSLVRLKEKRIGFLKVFICVWSHKHAGFSDKIIFHPFLTLQHEMFSILFC